MLNSCPTLNIGYSKIQKSLKNSFNYATVLLPAHYSLVQLLAMVYPEQQQQKKKSCVVLLKGSNLLSIGITEKSLFAL